MTEEKIIPSIDEFFQHCEPGAFNYKDAEAGDWHAIQCGDSDCSVGWHMVAYSVDMSRDENGNRAVCIHSVDQDGEWDCVDQFSEAAGDGPEQWIEFYQGLDAQMHDYFEGWVAYWEHVAETGRDVLGMVNSRSKDIEVIKSLAKAEAIRQKVYLDKM